MKNTPSHLENLSSFYLLVLNRIIEESTLKSRQKHPLWKTHGDEIIALYDQIFEQRKGKPIAQKISGLKNELETTLQNLENGVTCQICGVYTRNRIDQHIKRAHFQDPQEYHGDLWSNSLKTKFIDVASGPNNPWRNHGGKYSPFSKGSVNYSEEAIKKASENRSYNTRLDYYLNKGMTKEEAEETLFKRQQTFSLEKCLERYGQEGYKIFGQRQEKWQKSLNSKPQTEIDRIRMSKSTGRMNQLFSSNSQVKDIPGLVYVVKLTKQDTLEEFWKVGITSKTVTNRLWKPGTVKNGILLEIVYVHSTTFYNAFKLEQEILRQNKSIRTILKEATISTTEAFTKEPNYQILLKENS
jgi:hypothetical protein